MNGDYPRVNSGSCVVAPQIGSSLSHAEKLRLVYVFGKLCLSALTLGYYLNLALKNEIEDRGRISPLIEIIAFI